MTEQPVELARCNDHGLVLIEDEDGRNNKCVACELDIDARPDDDVPPDPTADGTISDKDFRNRLDFPTVSELIPLMEEYLDDVTEAGADGLHATHVAWEGKLPSGYSEQERFVLAIRYQFGGMEKYIIASDAARETIENLRSEGYGGES